MSTRAPRKRRQTADARRSLGRLERILLLVPYCVRHPGVSIAELAERLQTTEKEIIEDLELLFVCGLPDYTPADLIEVFIDEDHVSIRMADYFARPLRLTRTEAIPLYMKGHALMELIEGTTRRGGLEELAPLRSALEKLGKALLPGEGGVAELTKRIRVQLESGEAKWLPVLREAVTQNRRVDLEYYTYSRDAITRRQVDPYLVFASMGHWYISGHCHLVDDRRIFRLDRIKSLELTDQTFEPPEDGASELPPPLLYAPSPDDTKVRVRVPESVAVWLSEILPVEASKELRGKRRELVFRTSAFEWVEKMLMRLGTEVEVVEPSELADRLREGAKRILALYEPAKKRS
jgi:proteasome accessory factor C